MRRLLIPLSLAWLVSVALLSIPAAAPAPQHAAMPAAHAAPTFETSHNCVACHNGLLTPSGEDISFGVAWRATMMANSARDPYWQASVRREAIDHPNALHEIEDECSVCHMPMSHTLAVANGRAPQIFANLAAGAATPEALLARDGVSCALCHQITADRFGTPGSFTGGYVVNTAGPIGQRPVFGPYPIDPGRARLMHSATGFLPAEGAHLRQSELCATCHTLYTTALGPDGKPIGRLPEQVPYLEWRHSAYRTDQSCQSCHMPVVTEPTRISSVMGEPREGVGRHNFRGGNFFMLRMLNRYRIDLGVEALPQELDAAVNATLDHLARESASLSIDRTELAGGRLGFDVVVSNLTGHKLPTAYPARRAWLHVTVRDGAGATLFESGAIAPSGAIRGNDSDDDATRVEPHHEEIADAGQVQIYESVMRDQSGTPTTGLLKGIAYVKDNRLLPRGFDKRTAEPDIAVRGGAADDEDFTAGGDRVRYAVNVGPARGPFQLEVVLRYQPIGFRWAENLATYDAPEPRRFVGYYRSMSAASSAVLARAAASVSSRQP
jgi:hypothetical protein